MTGLPKVECGTFVLTDAEKRTIYDEAMKYQVERAARLPDETACLRAAFDAWVRLKELGWREAMYAPPDGSPLLLVEPGSTGVFRGYRDAERRFWVTDDDTWPSVPMLFREWAGEGGK